MPEPEQAYGSIIQSVNSSRRPDAGSADAAMAQVATAATAPTSLDVLRADPSGPLELGPILSDYVQGLKEGKTGPCVRVSLSYFTEAFRARGVRTSRVPLKGEAAAQLPVIASAEGKALSPGALLALWMSNPSAHSWNKLPSLCRGAGAPGALLYADLLEDRTIHKSGSGWPAGMTRGAVMQMWLSKEFFESVRDQGTAKVLGHSCVFLEYVPGHDDQIIVSDNWELKHPLSYPFLGMRYVMAGNLGKARLVSL